MRTYEVAKNYAETRAIRKQRKLDRCLDTLKDAESAAYAAHQSTGREEVRQAFNRLSALRLELARCIEKEEKQR